MRKIDEILNSGKIELDQQKVPEELESRLYNALQNKSVVKRQKSSWKLKLAVLAMAFVLGTYHMDTLAFYGRELLGFDHIMNGTLKELNKLGMGQSIEKSHTFSSGAKVTLNGVMIDDNQLLAFYTINSPEGDVEELNFSSNSIKGLLGEHQMESGNGQISEDKRIFKWVEEFEPPHAIERTLTWAFYIVKDGKREEGKISFVLDRDKAMGHTLRSKLNKSIRVDGTDIRFDSISASPTTTEVQGTIQNIWELANDRFSGERLFSPMLNIKLLADGKEVQQQGAGVSTDMKGMKFEVRYDALPEVLEKLQLHVLSFGAEHEVNEIVQLNKNSEHKTIEIKGQNITINKIFEEQGETFITITTEEAVILSRVYLLVDNKRVELTNTSEGALDKKEDGTITNTRTLRFKAGAENIRLEIKRMKYETICDEFIDIAID